MSRWLLLGVIALCACDAQGTLVIGEFESAKESKPNDLVPIIDTECVDGVMVITTIGGCFSGVNDAQLWRSEQLTGTVPTLQNPGAWDPAPATYHASKPSLTRGSWLGTRVVLEVDVLADGWENSWNSPHDVVRFQAAMPAPAKGEVHWVWISGEDADHAMPNRIPKPVQCGYDDASTSMDTLHTLRGPN